MKIENGGLIYLYLTADGESFCVSIQIADEILSLSKEIGVGLVVSKTKSKPQVHTHINFETLYKKVFVEHINETMFELLDKLRIRYKLTLTEQVSIFENLNKLTYTYENNPVSFGKWCD